MSQRLQKIIIGVVVVVLIGGSYLYLTGGQPDPETTTGPTQEGLLNVQEGGAGEAATSTGATVANQREILLMLQELRSISLNTEFLSSPAFEQLQFYEVSLQGQPVGRENPFAPITIEGLGTFQPDEILNMNPGTTSENQ